MAARILLSSVSAPSSTLPPRAPLTVRLLGRVERVGNALPHPATMFAAMAALVVVVSWCGHAAGLAVNHPTTGQPIRVVNLCSIEGVQRMLLEAVRNFIEFPPLGTSLVCLLGIGVAEHSGMIGATLRLFMRFAPRRLITATVVFVGVLANSGSELGYVLVVPLGAVIFHALHRHPLLGLAAAFAGVSGGYSANLLIGSVDVLLSGLSQAAARIVDAGYVVRPTATYYFNAVATFVITAAGTWVTERIVAPRLGEYAGEAPRERLEPLQPNERRGLIVAALVALVLAATVLAGVLPAEGFLRPAGSANFGDSVAMRGLVTFIFLFGLVPAVAYGIAARTLRNDHEVIAGMTSAMKSLAGYVVLAFFAAQFIAYFNWTNLGVITAVSGAGLIQHLGFHDSPVGLMVAFVLFAALVNLLVASASAKWALMAPVFVPLFMLLGFSPEAVQAAYGIGDSVTNLITPMMGYFPLVLTFVQRYEPKAGIGTLVAIMLPYSVVFLIVWTALLVVWIWLRLPVGPGSPLFLK